MKSLLALTKQRSFRLWGLSILVAVALVASLGAMQTGPYGQQWEYKTLWFRVSAEQDANALQREFAGVLNREAKAGWEYVGQCAHTNSSLTWMDFVVLRRPR